MQRALSAAQVALLLSIDEATWPRSSPGRGLALRASTDRTRLARDGLIAVRRVGERMRCQWVATALGAVRASQLREAEAERRSSRP